MVNPVSSGTVSQSASISRITSKAPMGGRFAAVGVKFGGLLLSALVASGANAQVNVLTAHNDIARTGQNVNETILTPATVNDAQFGKLFSQTVVGQSQAQPLYVAGVAIPGQGTHNVVYVETAGDYAYAFDADSNGGSNASPLWVNDFLTTLPSGARTNAGVVGTPVIDPATNTMYVVSSEYTKGVDINRLHALDITTGAEKFGGPVLVQAAVSGTGNGSVNGTLSFYAQIHVQRPGLLLLNGVLYMALGSQSDNGAWHGWIFSYNAATLQQIDIFCTTPNGSGGGIWMSGSGLAAEVNNPSQPYGRMFVVTGNGSFVGSSTHAAGSSLSMSVLGLDLTGGVMTVQDTFTPHNESKLNGQDGDVGSGGVVLLPNEKTAAGKTVDQLVQVGKAGVITLLNRDALGGFDGNADHAIQEIATPQSGSNGWGLGLWGSPTYWNNNVYYGGSTFTPTGTARPTTGLEAYSYANGLLSTAPTSVTTAQFAFPGPTTSVSANGTTGGIVWALSNGAYPSLGPSVLYAFDATNLANQLYSSADNPSRDDAGPAVKFTVPTVANGKVYVMTSGQLSVYGLLTAPTAATPIFTTPSESFSGTLQVAITAPTAGSSIYYTINGVTSLYTAPFTISSSETITAYASATGYLQSQTATVTYTALTNAANPTFSLGTGTYSGTQQLVLSDATGGSTIYYTLDGSTPTTSSAVYTKPLTVAVSETVEAIATAPNLAPSSEVGASYVIQPAYAIDYPNGFSAAQGPVQFNGSTGLDDFRLQLTDGGTSEAGSAFYATPVNVQAFTTDFTFQLSNPVANGITFAIQNVGPTALGASGSGLGYSGIGTSVAIKFDMYTNVGQGQNSTGLYLNGAQPTTPAIDLTGTGINLHSGDYIDAHVTYDGTDLTLTLSDEVTLATWSYSWAVNIPAAVGGNTAYVGFTGGTGASTSSQKITYWTYLPGAPVAPNYPAGFDTAGLSLNADDLHGPPVLSGTKLRLTNGSTYQSNSAFFTAPVDIRQFTTSFNFQLTNGTADGFTFAIQGVGPKAVGLYGSNLGYGSIPNSVAVKFDIHNNAGEGNDSTGLFTNGATPTVPAVNLSSTGINLLSGDIFNAQLTYNGTSLTVVITDTVTNASATHTYTVNIPANVGGPTAYVGFTAGTGGTPVVQDILNWTYSVTSSN
jgi:hypothetical protein